MVDIEYQLRSIEVINVNINARPKDYKGQKFHFDISGHARVNPDKKILFFFVAIIVREENEEYHLGKIETALGFEIGDFENVILKKEDNIYNIPIDLEIHLRTISISTTRGIMWSHFKGTHLHKALLPVVPQFLLPEANQSDPLEEKAISNQ